MYIPLYSALLLQVLSKVAFRNSSSSHNCFQVPDLGKQYVRSCFVFIEFPSPFWTKLSNQEEMVKIMWAGWRHSQKKPRQPGVSVYSAPTSTEFLNLSMTGIWGSIILCGTFFVVPCIVGWLTASLASTHYVPVVPFQFLTTKIVSGHYRMSPWR